MILKIFNFIFWIYSCVRANAAVNVWRSEDNLGELNFSLCHVGPRNCSQVNQAAWTLTCWAISPALSSYAYWTRSWASKISMPGSHLSSCFHLYYFLWTTLTWSFGTSHRWTENAVGLSRESVTRILKNSFCFLCVACLVAVTKCRMKRTQGRKVCSSSHLESVVGPPQCDRQGSRSWGRCSHCTCKPRARFLLSIQFRTPAQGWCRPQLGRIFPPQINSWKRSWSCLEACLPDDSRASQVSNISHYSL